jgi:hypothetical protein
LLSNRQNFTALFPGITLRSTTLPMNFIVPFWREFLMSMGFISVDRPALESIVKVKKGQTPKGNALLLVTGVRIFFNLNSYFV